MERSIAALVLASLVAVPSLGCAPKQRCECAVHVGGTAPSSGAEQDARSDSLARCLEAHGGGTIAGCPMPASVDRAPEPVTEGIADVTDTCPPISGGCYDGFDFVDLDGCPDPPGPMRVVFERGSARLSVDAAQEIADITERRPALAPAVRFVLIGHVSPDEPETLGPDRARSVLEAMVELGIASEQIEARADAPEDLEGADPDPHAVTIEALGCQ